MGSCLSTATAAWRDRRGAVAVMVALMMTSLLAVGGFAIDVGNVLRVKQALQASTDAAALAGASLVNQTAAAPTALTTAASWSATTGSKNAIPGVTATMLGGYPKVLCLKTLQSAPYNLTCTAPGGNAIQVGMTAQVPLVFGALVGYKKFTVSTIATASIGGGLGTNLDIAMILDTTKSMQNNDSACGNTRINCAMSGAQQLLNLFNPNIDNVALYVFPGLTSSSPASTVGIEYCSPSGTVLSNGAKNPPATTAEIANYNQSPIYRIVDLSNNYKVTPTSASLNTASTLSAALGVSGTGCAGVQVVGGVSTYYADAVTAAQTYLTASGRAKSQKVIILLSDGDANTTVVSSTPCKAGINAAKAATAANTWVYTLAYGAAGAGCSYDSGLTPCTTLQQMASVPASMFYSDGGASGCTGAISLANIVAAFKALGLSLQQRVLLPDNLT